MFQLASLFFDCPHCGAALSVGADQAGELITCQHCGGELLAPSEDMPIVAALPGERHGPGVANLSRYFFALAIVLAVGYVGYRAYGAWYSEPMVYLSAEEPFYYHELSPRALSLGLSEDSEQYPESEAVARGYAPVPDELKDTDAAAQREERQRLLDMYAQEESNAETPSAALDTDTRRQIEGVIMAAMSLPAGAELGPFQIQPYENFTYGVAVEVDIHGNDNAFQQWYGEVQLQQGQFVLLGVQAGPVSQAPKPLIDQRRNRDKPQWKIDLGPRDRRDRERGRQPNVALR